MSIPMALGWTAGVAFLLAVALFLGSFYFEDQAEEHDGWKKIADRLQVAAVVSVCSIPAWTLLAVWVEALT